jgi:DNA-binding HxlR family transcriptional regulator
VNLDPRPGRPPASTEDWATESGTEPTQGSAGAPPAPFPSPLRAPTVPPEASLSPAARPSGPSPLSEALELVGDRWSLRIIEALLPGPLRFAELIEAVHGIAPNILSGRLRRLQAVGLVAARPYQQRPPRASYQLTAEGRELAGVVRLLADWSLRYGHGEGVRHGPCGTPLEARWWCPTCGLPVAEEETEVGLIRI